ncbi:heavy metal translocating P-type ATPase [Photobacterium aphoticum]|uniref:P-type Cu(2+) transporter n=2 Tax=Photobacterium aphoticum TaxID=754436 RepID=A0A0J1GLB8_9GAMM|nr:heavy metal translocating P-type ATPase [Photobacterium aphoticum]KLV00508.1 ATPase P [Photobacterium aphoticum]PSU59861.1 cadmium-translocating P-type ATPase [Photobacterium aphoticum]GHA41739.1 copper-translocating P-type ATPase [Photobacterium aphoticum]
MTKDCYHCGDPVPQDYHHQVEILGQPRDMCCPGCEAVAQTIVASGLTSYYEFRTAPAEKADLVPQQLQSLLLYDHEDIQQEFVRDNANHKEASLSLDGVSCAACAWLIEKQLKREAGVINIRVNTTTHRALLVWDPEQTKLSHLLNIIHQLGYKAAPFEADAQEQLYHRTMKNYLYRLGIAGIATMQVMMLAVALYFEIFGDLDAEFKNYLRWVSLIFATPVLLYSALPFYLNAWRNLRARTLGMDVPVSIALLFAYIASLYATVMEKGEVFFESISMFTFFLLLGRFLEMRARRQAAAASANLLKLVPAMATLADGSQVAAKTLKISDVVTVLPGESLPADGEIVQGETAIDESMLTGEPMPVSRSVGDNVFAGTINGDGNITLRVTQDRNNSLISNIVRLQDEAQSSKPKVAEIADIVARYFVAAILVISACTWFYWYQHRPEDALWITLAVLVATCPCALSLATPTALTCSTSSLGRLGILLRRGHVLETLCNVNQLVIDKTGTLTEGNVRLIDTHLVTPQSHMRWEETDVLATAAELERFANHPIARAFSGYRNSAYQFEQVENVIGSGLKGWRQGQEWRIGKAEFVLAEHPDYDAQLANCDERYQVWLSCDHELVAAFMLDDPIREDSAELIKQFKAAGIHVTMLTGDHSSAAHTVATALGIDELVAGASPEGKLAYLRSLPKEKVALMIGDGVNDAPVLAGAHLSVAMGGGTDVAKSSADMVLLGDQLSRILKARQLAIKTRKIIRENLAWSLGYNLIILPLAVAGFVAPYIAVVGMSGSSIIVVSNSLRLLKDNV